MKKIFLILLTANLCFTAHGQSKKEFTGLVTFTHKIIPKEKGYDVNYDFSAIGKTSDFYYKDGNIKWLTYDSYFKISWFVAKEDRDYMLTNKSDTIYTMKNKARDFEIVDHRISASDEVIAGHKCKVLQLTIKSFDAASPLTYRRYYFSEDFYIDPKKMAQCQSNGYDVIYGDIKSIPLKIEYEFANRIVVWEATEVKPMKLENSFFEVDKKIPVAYW